MAGLADFLNATEPSDSAGSNGFSIAAIPDDEPAPAAAAPEKGRVRQLGPNAQAATGRMRRHFAEGKVQLPVYNQFYSALLHGCQSPEEVRLASDLADLAYLQWIQKQS